MPPKVIKLYRTAEGSVVSRIPKKTCQDVLTFECLLLDDAKKLHALRNFIRSIVTDMDHVNKIKKSVEDATRKVRGLAPFRPRKPVGEIIYIWTYLPLPSNWQNKGVCSEAVFNQIIPFDLSFVPDLDNNSMDWKTIQKELDTTLYFRDISYDKSTPESEVPEVQTWKDLGVHSIKCFSGMVTQ